MRDLTQYAPTGSRFCVGADSLRGALGVVWCQARRISTLPRCYKILPRLTETPSRIVEAQHSLALSVLVCEEIENNPPLGGHLTFRYKAVYLVWDTATVGVEDSGWAQVQLMHLAPPKGSF